MKRVAPIVLAVIVIAGATAWYWPRHEGRDVLKLPGIVEVQEVRLGSKIGGRVGVVHVREGQTVEANSLLVTFDSPELVARRDAARARLESAQATLDKVNRGPRDEEIAEAKAVADAAKAKYDKMLAGFREEQKEQAKNDLDAALAEEKQATDEMTRVQLLSGTSTVSKTEYSFALMARDRARARVRSSRATHEMMLTGNRPEEKAEAKAEAERADAHHLLLKNGSRTEDKAAAYANFNEAQAALNEAEANLREATITAPEKCFVQTLPVRSGSLVAAGQPVIIIHRTEDLWVKVFVPSTELGKLQLGQAVEVSVDSHPGKRFPGEVMQISVVSEFTPRNVQSLDERQHQVFAVKVRVSDNEGVFKSGMAAEVFVSLNGGK
jgi:multidrug resistance efflux pump